mmetsp:Transcript_41787/g.118287  ORF Transcript_41787/g.118287 Transcript_41787/m.118287 type:complete len:573 (-) Transcript_41787:71-1789(-)
MVSGQGRLWRWVEPPSLPPTEQRRVGMRVVVLRGSGARRPKAELDVTEAELQLSRWVLRQPMGVRGRIALHQHPELLELRVFRLYDGEDVQWSARRGVHLPHDVLDVLSQCQTPGVFGIGISEVLGVGYGDSRHGGVAGLPDDIPQIVPTLERKHVPSAALYEEGPPHRQEVGHKARRCQLGGLHNVKLAIRAHLPIAAQVPALPTPAPSGRKQLCRNEAHGLAEGRREVGTSDAEQPLAFHPTQQPGELRGCSPVEIPLHHVGAGGRQGLEDPKRPVHHRDVQRRPLRGEARGVRVRPGSQQCLRQLREAMLGAVVQRRLPALPALLVARVGAAGEQAADDAHGLALHDADGVFERHRHEVRVRQRLLRGDIEAVVVAEEPPGHPGLLQQRPVQPVLHLRHADHRCDERPAHAPAGRRAEGQSVLDLEPHERLDDVGVQEVRRPRQVAPLLLRLLRRTGTPPAHHQRQRPRHVRHARVAIPGRPGGRRPPKRASQERRRQEARPEHDEHGAPTNDQLDQGAQGHANLVLGAQVRLHLMRLRLGSSVEQQLHRKGISAVCRDVQSGPAAGPA